MLEARRAEVLSREAAYKSNWTAKMHTAPIPFVPRTKLRPPRLPDDILVRTRLLERLNRAQTLALIIAPAGFGKTTLACTWLAQHGHPYAWLALEDEDNTPAVFLAGLVGAVRRVFPAFGAALLALLEEPTGALTPARVLPALLNGLDMLEQNFVLVLDDYHHIADPSVHQLLWGLLTYPPRPLQLVVTTRYDPPIPPRLRSQGTVTELRMRDLRFTAAETAKFLSRCGTKLWDADATAAVVEQTEGWAVPLRLMAMHLDQQPDVASLEAALSRCGRPLLDYLDAEVIGRLPATVQTFLTRTSILHRLTPRLCDAVAGAGGPEGVNGSNADVAHDLDSAATLQWLIQAGIFTECLDENGGWFRYHELFRLLLQRRLRSTHDPQEIDRLVQRARRWREEHGLPEDTDQDSIDLGDSLRSIPSVQAQSPQPGVLVAALCVQRQKQPLNMLPPTSAPAQCAPVQVRGEHNLRELITFREMDVLLLLNQRLTNKEIARVLEISPETVRQHAGNIYRKLGVGNRRQAVVRAIALGVIATENSPQLSQPFDGVTIIGSEYR